MPTLDDIRPSQPHAVAILDRALAAERLHHAYIFDGQYFTAVVDIGTALGQSLMCSQRAGAAACQSCAGCRKFLGGNHPDLTIIKPDNKGMIVIKQIRGLIDRTALHASESGMKVAIIHNADGMNPKAQNSLLKTLEEPTGQCCFILLTTRYLSLLPTIRSRCLRVRTAPMSRPHIQKFLIAAAIPRSIAPHCAALVGPDVEAAQAMVEAGACEILDTLQQTLGAQGDCQNILEVARNLGADRDKADLALSLLEVDVRDRLALHFGGEHAQLADASSASRFPGQEIHLAGAAKRLALIRNQRGIYVNRTMALEGVLLQLAGYLGDTTLL